jgi:ATP-binding cassette subfamily B protein
MAAFALVVTGASLLSAAPPIILARVIDRAIPAGDERSVIFLCVAMMGAGALECALRLVSAGVAAHVGSGVAFDLRVGLFSHLQRVPFRFFSLSRTGALVSRLGHEIDGVQQALSISLGVLFADIVTIVVTLSAMVALDWRITGILVLLVPLFFAPAKVGSSAYRRMTLQVMDASASLTARLTERFDEGGALLASMFSNPERERMEVAERATRLRKAHQRSAVVVAALTSALGLVATLTTSVVYLIGGVLSANGSVPIGTLVAMSVLVLRLLPVLMGMANSRAQVAAMMVSFDRCFEVLDVETLGSVPARALAHPVAGEVSFEGVSFSYGLAVPHVVPSLAHGDEADGSGAAERLVLRDIDLTIRAGETVALVGSSGAGKTTLAMLVPRLYDPTRGVVRIDGQDLQDLDPLVVRRQVGIVPQDPILFHDTVAGNLRLARPDATDDELVEACEMANVHDVVGRLPQGYATMVGERGYRLSGGEKQRLAIARVLLSDPRIVILDEATSHVDSENEVAIQGALADALAGRTVIVIAHRLSTIVSADVIVVLAEGAIVERGSHHDLLAAHGYYSAMYRSFSTDGATSRGTDSAPVVAGR